MPKSKNSQNIQKKRNLSSPDNGGGQPEKRTTVKNTISSQESSQVQNSVNSMNPSGFIQLMNMSSMNNYNNYQTPVGTFYTPSQQQCLPQVLNQCPLQ